LGVLPLPQLSERCSCSVSVQPWHSPPPPKFLRPGNVPPNTNGVFQHLSYEVWNDRVGGDFRLPCIAFSYQVLCFLVGILTKGLPESFFFLSFDFLGRSLGARGVCLHRPPPPSLVFLILLIWRRLTVPPSGGPLRLLAPLRPIFPLLPFLFRLPSGTLEMRMFPPSCGPYFRAYGSLGLFS